MLAGWVAVGVVRVVGLAPNQPNRHPASQPAQRLLGLPGNYLLFWLLLFNPLPLRVHQRFRDSLTPHTVSCVLRVPHPPPTVHPHRQQRHRHVEQLQQQPQTRLVEAVGVPLLRARGKGEVVHGQRTVVLIMDIRGS